jgi:hypothetical protein
MILSEFPKARQVANVAGRNMRIMKRIRSNIRGFGTTTTSWNSVGRSRSINPPMLNALLEYILD